MKAGFPALSLIVLGLHLTAAVPSIAPSTISRLAELTESYADSPIAPPGFDTYTSAAPTSPYARVAAYGSVGNIAPSPGLKDVPGTNVTLLTYNTTCTGFGPASLGDPPTRISGDGVFNGTGLFVGEGTFTASPASEVPSFTIANGSFLGTAYCRGWGQYTTEDPKTTLSGNGTLKGGGLFHVPDGVMDGFGTVNASDLFFEKPTVLSTFSGAGELNGTGTASGQSILCLGYGSIQGDIALTGSGSFVGRGFYRAIQPTDVATFTGTGLLKGDGVCDQGRAAVLESKEEAGSDINALIDYGDIIYGSVRASQAAAVPFLPPSIAKAANMARAVTAPNAVNG